MHAKPTDMLTEKSNPTEAAPEIDAAIRAVCSIRHPGYSTAIECGAASD
jgi:hypothetical protein